VESTNIAKERFRNGQINLFEFKDTQLVLEDCKVRVANARFEALSSEAELKRLNSEIPTAQ
jgi:outer membrane protein TolC